MWPLCVCAWGAALVSDMFGDLGYGFGEIDGVIRALESPRIVHMWEIRGRE